MHLYSLFSSTNISVYFRWLVVCLFLLCLTLEFGFCRDSSRRSTSTQKRFRADQSALMYGINVAVCRLDDLLNKKLSLVSRGSWAVAKDVSAASCPRILPIPLIPFPSYFVGSLDTQRGRGKVGSLPNGGITFCCRWGAAPAGAERGQWHRMRPSLAVGMSLTPSGQRVHPSAGH